MPLSPEIAQINELIQAVRAEAPPPTVELMRDGWAQLMGQVATETTACLVEPLDVGGLKSLSFTPPTTDGGLLVWFHGGGWVVGSPSLAINEVDRLCAATRCRGISVDYRLAPEHPFPAPQLDGIAAATWCLAHAGELGAEPSKVAVGGDSAGGNLAAVAGQRVPGLAAQVLVYPGCDLTAARRAAHRHTEGYLLDEETIEYFFSCAAGDADLADPLLSPLLAAEDALAAAPPAYVITAEYDPLRDETAEYAAALRSAGVHVEELHFEHEMHGFFNMPEVVADARDAIAGAAAFLTKQFAAA
jgi:acetyl esterase